jgi:DNA-binding transcriptional regulator LsrR (DeoR family)
MFTRFSIKPGRLISDNVSRAIRADAKTGMTVEELAVKYDVSETTIRRHTFASITVRKQLNEFQIREIRTMYKQGATQAELAERFHLSPSKVQLVCARKNG